MKANKHLTRLLTIILFAMFIYHCTGSAYEKMAIQQPLALISVEDSLRKSGLSKKLELSLAIAHRQVGIDKMKLREYNTALEHFEKSMRSLEKDTTLLYNTFICKGLVKYETGKIEKLWDAIELFNKASQLKPEEGSQHFYMGLSYHKLGNTDFDLIIDSYKRALSLNNNEELVYEVKTHLEEALRRERVLNEFWK